MAENALRWPMVDETYLEVVGCLGAALMVLLVGDMNFKIVDGFVMVLGTGLTLVLVNVKGLGGARMLREPMDSSRSFSVMSTLKIISAALEIFWHMLNCRSSMSCFGLE